MRLTQTRPWLRPLISIIYGHFLVTFAVAVLSFLPRTSLSIPFVVFHGISDKCNNKGISQFISLLSDWSGAQGHCIEIGNGALDSWTMPFFEQTALACEKVKSMSELSGGYNIIGLPQGNLVGRGVIELCDRGPPVRNFVSLAGPHAGIAAIPLCKFLWKDLNNSYVSLVLHSSGLFDRVGSLQQLRSALCGLQEHLAPTNYIKIPTVIAIHGRIYLIGMGTLLSHDQDLDSYKNGCKFLPVLNNEFHKNSTYKKRFSSLENLVLIKFENDVVLVPKETSWFGYFPDGSWDPILPAQETTTLYTEDWIGLKTLDEAGRVKFVNVSGSHLEISYGEMKDYIFPYLLENSTAQPRLSKSSHVSAWSSHEGKKLKLYDSD
ncbi:hypothetical protein SASPL_109133 [Salvia splendens]|uniref:Palmitoyl-protein thioesterase n=1 Tax=Salvia splendens TaxID=180675 RepID=A0A8X8YK22_SALSN|nr:hypothetical protein SASPL_109133 [Salvia splendens]